MTSVGSSTQSTSWISGAGVTAPGSMGSNVHVAFFQFFDPNMQTMLDGMYSKLDPNNAGQVTQSDFTQVVEAAGATQASADAFWKVVSQGASTINKAEFELYALSAQGGIDATFSGSATDPTAKGWTDAELIAGKADLDGLQSGDLATFDSIAGSQSTLSESDFANWAKSKGISAGDAQQIFSGMDSDGDGQVTATEAKAYIDTLHEDLQSALGLSQPAPSADSAVAAFEALCRAAPDSAIDPVENGAAGFSEVALTAAAGLAEPAPTSDSAE